MKNQSQKTVNDACPMCGGDVDTDVQSQWQKQNVSFCSEQCQDEWTELDEETKREKLNEIISQSGKGG